MAEEQRSERDINGELLIVLSSRMWATHIQQNPDHGRKVWMVKHYFDQYTRPSIKWFDDYAEANAFYEESLRQWCLRQATQALIGE